MKQKLALGSQEFSEVIRERDIVEFKINQSAGKAIQKIKDKKYALTYTNDERPI